MLRLDLLCPRARLQVPLTCHGWAKAEARVSLSPSAMFVNADTGVNEHSPLEAVAQCSSAAALRGASIEATDANLVSRNRPP